MIGVVLLLNIWRKPAFNRSIQSVNAYSCHPWHEFSLTNQSLIFSKLDVMYKYTYIILSIT